MKRFKLKFIMANEKVQMVDAEAGMSLKATCQNLKVNLNQLQVHVQERGEGPFRHASPSALDHFVPEEGDVIRLQPAVTAGERCGMCNNVVRHGECNTCGWIAA